ncbi:MAG: phosphatidylglycerol lysyltransferase [Treponema sp.]|jgi:phosphoglucomutase|nr:phosphatidylglycerol lysyltransferase [Treponema sp.]
MAIRDEIDSFLSGMILSHSGWRGVFSVSGDEEDRTGKISAAQGIVAAAAAVVFAEYLRSGAAADESRPVVLVGRDSRPSGKALADMANAVLIAHNCEPRYAGITAAPEIMAWARSLNDLPGRRGFIYISASHNPIGHNGFKFGLTDGGVLPAQEMAALGANLRAILADPGRAALLEKIVNDVNKNGPAESASAAAEAEAYAKKEALDTYFKFCDEVAWGGGANAAFREGAAAHPLGVCCDFNGSARCVSIDRDFFTSLGIRFEAINAKPGGIVHRIIPEGESLEPCRVLLEEARRRDSCFALGYVPDCDGDRGNLVVWDGKLQKARALEAQEVFALACVAELAQLAQRAQRTRNSCMSPNGKALPHGNLPYGTLPYAAIAVNDPTSFRIDRIAAAFGASVFRAETGEANVVALARKLRKDGYTVRILGEGSNGGNITHPSAVRDPLNTVLALAKLLMVRSADGRPGLFELWCNASGHVYRPDFSMADIIESLPPFTTTPASAPEAALKITSADHGALKSRYRKIFIDEWEKLKDGFASRYGIYRWEAKAYNGTEERDVTDDFSASGKGGLKICFLNADGRPLASIWMRGSATEPVFRIMADVEGTDRQFEQELINWQRSMTIEADKQTGNRS